MFFGSHARGMGGAHSDVDPRCRDEAERLTAIEGVEIDLALADRSVLLDLIVVTPEEFERGWDQIGSILRQAARRSSLKETLVS